MPGGGADSNSGSIFRIGDRKRTAGGAPKKSARRVHDQSAGGSSKEGARRLFQRSASGRRRAVSRGEIDAAETGRLKERDQCIHILGVRCP